MGSITKDMELRSVLFLAEHTVVKRHCRFYFGRSIFLLTCRSCCLALIKDTVTVRAEIKIKLAFGRYQLVSLSGTFYIMFFLIIPIPPSKCSNNAPNSIRLQPLSFKICSASHLIKSCTAYSQTI